MPEVRRQEALGVSHEEPLVLLGLRPLLREQPLSRDVFRAVTKKQWRSLAIGALVLLTSTVFTSDRILTPRQRAARKRLLRAAGRLGRR